MSKPSLTFPVAVNIDGITEDQYNKIYDILLGVGVGYELRDYHYHVEYSNYEYIGVDHMGDIIHYRNTAAYPEYPNGSIDFYTAEEFLAKFSDNKRSLENSSKNVRKRPNMQRSSSKCIVYYTDGSSYTINNFQNLIETDATVIIEYIAPERKVVVEHGILITEASSHKSVEIDKEHLAGIVIKQQNGEDRVIRYSHLFASKQYVANQKNKMKAWSKRMKKAVQRDNVYANDLVDCPSEDVQSAGYKLADGTYSSQYKIGDKFVVVTSNTVFYEDSVVTLHFNNGTSTPIFILFSGGMISNSYNNIAHCGWRNLKAYTE